MSKHTDKCFSNTCSAETRGSRGTRDVLRTNHGRSKMRDCIFPHRTNVLSLSPFYRLLCRWSWISRYQNVSILDFIAAKGGGGGDTRCGGDVWSYIRRAKLQSDCHHQQTNTQLFYRPDARPTNSVKALAKSYPILHGVINI